MALANLGLAFTAGFMATLAPCALPMLPSYVAYYLNLGEQRSVKRSLSFAVTTVAGFMTLYVVIGLLPGVLVNQAASRIDLALPFVGILLILLGIITGFTRLIEYLPVIPVEAPMRAGLRSFYLYGLGYGAASVSCGFPVFILLILQAASAGGPIDVLVMFLAYGAGAASLLIPLTLALSYSKDVIYTRLMRYLPYVKKANALVLVFAGLYMLLYWLAM